MATKENDFEMYFRWYCEELKQEGYLEDFTREGETFMILPAQTHNREKHFKSKKNEVEEFTILGDMKYTYDFRLVWNPKAEYIFYETFFPHVPFVFGHPTFVAHELTINGENKIVSYVDVKPHRSAAEHGGKVSSFYTFPFIQKIAFHLYKLYFNKAIPVHAGKKGWSTCLFSQTFVPNRYLFTNQSQQLRKIPYKKTSISQYVKNRMAYIEAYKQKQSQQKLL